MNRNLKQTLSEGRVVVGTWLNTRSEDQAEIIGHAGFDFVIADTEHGNFDVEGAQSLVRAAASADLPVLIRVSESGSAAIGKVLDFGAQGVMVPHIGSGAEATRVVRAARYAPRGARGAAPNVRAARYGQVPWHEHVARSGAETLVVLQVEGQEGLRHLDDIVAVEGVDVVFVGPFDLSNALGVGGQLEHPLLLQTIGEIVGRVRARGLAVGIWMPDPATVGPWIERGVQFVTVANSDKIFLEACRGYVEAVRARIPSERHSAAERPVDASSG
jgi:4-hydroxy-2-oxoheptanedioate aldolase